MFAFDSFFPILIINTGDIASTSEWRTTLNGYYQGHCDLEYFHLTDSTATRLLNVAFWPRSTPMAFSNMVSIYLNSFASDNHDGYVITNPDQVQHLYSATNSLLLSPGEDVSKLE